MHRVSAASAPLMYEFEADGRAALPLSILLEFAAAAGEWIQPDGVTAAALTEFTDITANLSALTAQAGDFVFERIGAPRTGRRRLDRNGDLCRTGQWRPVRERQSGLRRCLVVRRDGRRASGLRLQRRSNRQRPPVCTGVAFT